MCIYITDIELEVFLKFNRIKALTDEVKVIADAVSYKSDLLQVIIKVIYLVTTDLHHLNILQLKPESYSNALAFVMGHLIW